ncbi:hypothetical protein Tco_0668745 [Tanacetum coccineum]
MIWLSSLKRENPLISFFLRLANDVEQLLDDEKLFFMNSNPGGLLKSEELSFVSELVELKLIMYFVLGTAFIFPPYQLYYPERKLTMEEMLNKFINEGKHEQEEMEIFFNEFRTTNELLLKEQNNLLSELEIGVYELGRVMHDILVSRHEIKGVTTRGGKMTTEPTYSKEVNIDHNQPPGSKPNEPDKL